MRREKPKSRGRKILDDIIFIVVVVFLIRTFVFESYRIPSGSMEDTLLIGDFLFGLKFWYGIKIPFANKFIIQWAHPHRGEIVIFRSPYEWRNLVKRCVALGGDIVEIRNKKLYVNGKPIDEPYVKYIDRMTFPGLELDSVTYQRMWERGEFRFFSRPQLLRDNFGPVRVPEGTIFVMGDNRDNSYDSRFFGPLPERYLLGIPFIYWWSWDGTIPLWRVLEKFESVRWYKIGRLIPWRYHYNKW